MQPSDYFDRNIKIGSSNTRRREIGRRYEIGVDNIMWGNDFPHPEGTWPYTREFLKERFWDVPIDETERMLGLNHADFYGFDVERAAPDRATASGPPPRSSARPTRRSSRSGTTCARSGAPGSPARKPPAPACTDSHPSLSIDHQEGPPMTAPAPQINPGEIADWPLLKIVYRTDPDRIADLLPPGITPGASPNVYVNIYCVPVLGEPEYGVSTKVDANYDGIARLYCLGMGIDQEAAIFISQELNGQPKFPCAIKFFRLGDQVEARCTHQGYTFLEFRGQVTGVVDVDPGRLRRERVVDQVVACRRRRREELRLPAACRRRRVGRRRPSARRSSTATLLLRDSPWDPYTDAVADARAGLGAPGDGRAAEPRDHARRPARPDRVLALRRHHRRITLARVHGRPPVRALTVASPHAP